MAIVVGFDVHRAQITFDALDLESGEVHRGRMHATPEAVGEWVGRFPGALLAVAAACRNALPPGRPRSGPARVVREALWFIWEGRGCPIRSSRASTRSRIRGRLVRELFMPNTLASGRRAGGDW